MKKIVYLSYIRAVACIAIVLLHTVDGAVIMYQNQISGGERVASLSVVYCMMWAVPCFVMVTGALLLTKDRTITIKDIFRKYILRILVVLFVFSWIFALFDSLMNKDGGGLSFLWKGFINALTGNGWAHMWYLYLLIGLYLLLIFYRKVAHHVSAKEYRFLLIVYVVFLSILPILQMWNVRAGFYIHVSTIYPFYLFAGYAIAAEILKINKWLSVMLMLIGVVGIVIMAVLEPRYVNISYGNLLDYASIFVILLSIGVFSFVKSYWGERIKSTKINDTITVYEEKKPGIVGRILLEIDRCSFGIYLIHMIFVRLVIRYWKLNPYPSGVTILIFAGVVIGITAVSYGITYLLKQIPGVKKIL